MAYVTVSRDKSTPDAHVAGYIWLERVKVAFTLPIALFAIAARPDLFEPDLD